MNEKISAWQTAIIMFILTFANKILALPSLLYERTKLEACFVVATLLLFDLGLLLLFYFLKKKFPNASFKDLIENYCGKFVKCLVFVLIMIYFMFKAVLLYNVTYNFFKFMIYKESSNLVFLFCFIPIINHLAVCGLRAMGRTCQLFFPVIVVIVVFCVVVGFFGIQDGTLLFESSPSDFLITLLRHLSSFGDYIFLFVIMDKIEIKKGQWKVMFLSAVSAMLCVFLVTLIFVLAYSYTAFMHPFAIFEIISYIKEYGGLGRLDIIAMVVIIMFSYFQLAIYLKIFMVSFDAVFENLKQIYSVLTFNFIFILLVNFVVLNLGNAIFYAENYLPFLSVISFLIVPILAGIFLIFNPRKTKEVKKE